MRRALVLAALLLLAAPALAQPPTPAGDDEQRLADLLVELLGYRTRPPLTARPAEDILREIRAAAQRLLGGDPEKLERRFDALAGAVLRTHHPDHVAAWEAQLRRRDVARTRAYLHTIRQALEQHMVDEARYPTTEEGLEILFGSGGRGGLPYLGRSVRTVDAWGHAFVYRAPGRGGAPYDLRSVGPDGAEGTADDIE